MVYERATPATVVEPSGEPDEPAVENLPPEPVTLYFHEIPKEC